MAEDVKDNSSGELYSAAAEVSKNLIELFRKATMSMMTNDLRMWWIYLDAIYIETDFAIKEKDREKMEELWKTINPNLKSSYGLLKEYHIKLRRLCEKFFVMVDTRGNPGTAIYQGNRR